MAMLNNQMVTILFPLVANHWLIIVADKDN